MMISMWMHPHGWCLMWDGPLVGVHVVADALIALAYFMIPSILISMRKLFQWEVPRTLFLLFGAFIICCGMTHVMDIIVLWYPFYWMQAAVKGLTAAISLATGGYLLDVISGRNSVRWAFDQRYTEIPPEVKKS